MNKEICDRLMEIYGSVRTADKTAKCWMLDVGFSASPVFMRESRDFRWFLKMLVLKMLVSGVFSRFGVCLGCERCAARQKLPHFAAVH